MKISLFGATNEFNDTLFDRLQAALSSDSFLRWIPGSAPDPSTEVILGVGKLGEAELSQCPTVGLLQTVSDGYDAVDVAAATRLGIWVSYAPGDATGNADSVAEYAVLLLLAASRRLNQALAALHDPSLPRPLLNRALTGKKVCIVGLGVIGTKIADRLRPFGVQLSALDRHPDKHHADFPVTAITDLNSGLADQDYVVLCVRGSDQNKHLVNKEFLAAMKPGSTLVNIARGSLVDEAALTEALRSGHLVAAGLDVLEHEPPQPTNPLLGIPQAFLTPHIAGFTDLFLDGSVQFLENILDQYRQGKHFSSILNQPEHPRHPLA